MVRIAPQKQFLSRAEVCEHHRVHAGGRAARKQQRSPRAGGFGQQRFRPPYAALGRVEIVGADKLGHIKRRIDPGKPPLVARHVKAHAALRKKQHLVNRPCKVPIHSINQL